MVSANILLTEVKTEVIQGSPKMEGTKSLTGPRLIPSHNDFGLFHFR